MRAYDQTLIREPFVAEALRARRWAIGRGEPLSAISRDIRVVSAKATRNGADVYVMVFVAEPDSVWQMPATVVIVAKPAAMEAGKVTVSSEQLKKGLADDGRISLYGIYFDSSAPSSNPNRKRSSTRWRGC